MAKVKKRVNSKKTKKATKSLNKPKELIPEEHSKASTAKSPANTKRLKKSPERLPSKKTTPKHHVTKPPNPKIVKTPELKSQFSVNPQFPNNPQIFPEQPQKNVRKVHFPNIFRLFTERILWASFILTILIIAIIYASKDLQEALNTKKDLKARRTKVEKQISSLQNWLKIYPDYRDGFIQLSRLETEVGEYDKALTDARKAQALDPNFTPIPTLIQEIQNHK